MKLPPPFPFLHLCYHLPSPSMVVIASLTVPFMWRKVSLSLISHSLPPVSHCMIISVSATSPGFHYMCVCVCVCVCSKKAFIIHCINTHVHTHVRAHTHTHTHTHTHSPLKSIFESVTFSFILLEIKVFNGVIRHTLEQD